MTIAAIALGLAALSGQPSPTAAAPDLRPAMIQQESRESIRQKLGAAIDQERFEEALLLSKALLAHPDTARVPAEERRAIIWLQALLHLQLDRPAAALPLLQEVTASPEATLQQWSTRLEAHNKATDLSGAAVVFTEILQRFPSAANEYYDVFVLQLVMNPELEGDIGFNAREALYRSGWTNDDDSWLWLKLVDDYIDRGRLDDARQLVSRIRAPGPRLQLFALRRYDEVRSADARLNLDAAWAAELALARKDADKTGASIKDRSRVPALLYDLGRPEEALAAADAILAGPEPEAGSVDAEDYTWVLNGRSRILMALGRGEEAVAQQEAAAARQEYGSQNVSQTINLGWTYLRLGRTEEATAALAGLEEDRLSAYGKMQARQVRACAARERGDAAAAEVIEAVMGENWRDAPIAAYEVAACRGDEDEMARVLVGMLADPETVGEGVSLMHGYLDAGRTDYDRRMLAIHHRVIARPEVVAARDAVGRAFVVPTMGPQF